MDSILAIGVGLVLRVVVDVATDNDDRIGGVLVGLWEGVVLNHFVRRMPRSFDPYLGFGLRIFVDFLFTQSVSRLALVALWSLVGMLLADIAPNIWRDSGLRHIYRQVRKDVRHVQRAVPRIRIENDLPSVRLFKKSRSTSLDVSTSIRSDIATPSRSTAPSPAPTLGPARRQGRSPPGTFPDVSGWSETGTDLSTSRRPIIYPSPSPSLIPTQEHGHAAYERMDSVHVTTSQTRTTTAQNTTITITQTESESVTSNADVGVTALGAGAVSASVQPVAEPLHLDPPAILDDWVDVDHPTPAPASGGIEGSREVKPIEGVAVSEEVKPNKGGGTDERVGVSEEAGPIQGGGTNEGVVPSKPDSDPTPTRQPGPSTPTPSPPPSVLAPTVIDIPSGPLDIDFDDRASQFPDQIPLPESRAASVIGGVYDQPQPRSTLRDNFRFRSEMATSEIGVDFGKSVALPVAKKPTKGQSSLRSSLTGFWSRSKNQAEPDVPKPPPTETLKEPVGQTKLDVGSVSQGAEPQLPTPAQVDPPASILTHPRDTSPLLLAPVDLGPKQQAQSKPSKQEQVPTSAGADSSPAPPQERAIKGTTAGPQASLLDLPSPSRSPPPPFTEFAGISPVGLENPADKDPVTQDEAPTELTAVQKAAEEKRIAFLLTQVGELERSRADLQGKMDGEDDPKTSPARAIESELDETRKTLNEIKARINKKKFSDPPSDPPVREVTITNTSAGEIQFAVTSAILNELLERQDAGPMTIQASVGISKPKKKKEARDVVIAFAKRHQFVAQSEANSVSVTVTF